MKVASDYQLLSTMISDIKSKANFILSNLTDEISTYDSSTIVPNCEAQIIKKYNNSTYILLSKLINEIDSILSIGESIKDMDKFLGREAMKLNFEVSLSNTQNSQNMSVSSTNVDTSLSSETQYIIKQYDIIHIEDKEDNND